jgi:hypothetical protein
MSTPRFTDDKLLPVKRLMLARQPTFLLTLGDVETLVRETGLLKSQIQDWVKHFRHRFGSKYLDEILEYLRGDKKVTWSFENIICSYSTNPELS